MGAVSPGSRYRCAEFGYIIEKYMLGVGRYDAEGRVKGQWRCGIRRLQPARPAENEPRTCAERASGGAVVCARVGPALCVTMGAVLFISVLGGCGLLFTDGIPVSSDDESRLYPIDAPGGNVPESGDENDESGLPAHARPSDLETGLWTWENVQRCSEARDNATLAHYSFAGRAPWASLVAGVPEVEVRAMEGGYVAAVDGGPCNGPFVRLPQLSDGEGYLKLSHHANWDLEAGAIDLWFRYKNAPNENEFGGILCRDELNQNDPGHFCLVLVGPSAAESHMGEEGLRVRMQGSANEGESLVGTAMDKVPPNVWHHVVVSWENEGVSLYLNGILESYAEGARSIAGNSLDWVIGAETTRSTIRHRLNDLEVALFRIHTTPRHF